MYIYAYNQYSGFPFELKRVKYTQDKVLGIIV